MGRRRFGGTNEMGIFLRGWRIWKDEDLDLPAWLNIEQVWTHVLRFTQLMFLELLTDRERSFGIFAGREREKEVGIEEGR